MAEVDLDQNHEKVGSKYLIDPPLCEDKNVSVIKTKEERVGRSEQVYNKSTFARLVGGGVVLNKSHDKVLMISSTKHSDKWVLPKGGIEFDEANNFSLSALRETWEEAGVIGRILKKLPVVEDHRFLKEKDYEKVSKAIDLNIDGMKIPRTEFHFYEMEVEELSQEWPESHMRQRRWCNYEEAKHELIKSQRPELIEALNDSDILKNCPNLKYDEHSNILLDTEPTTDDY